MPTPMSVTIYTDGCAHENPGPGGYAAIVLHPDGRRVELAAGYRLTTNNRMELMGVLVALDTLPDGTRAHVLSDSQYVVNGSEWSKGWAARGYRRKRGPVLNVDLWMRLRAACTRLHVTFEWVKGHAGDRFNERCDRLANRALATEIDHGFLSPSHPTLTLFD